MANRNPPDEVGEVVSVMGGSGTIYHVLRHSPDTLQLRADGAPDEIAFTFIEGDPGEYQVKPAGGVLSGLWLKWDLLLDRL